MDSPNRQALVRAARKVRAKKKLGQNFFVDPIGLSKIVDSLDAEACDRIVEIGPGLGFLTDYLERTGAKITAVEFDRDMVDHLESKFENSKNVEIIHGDFLDFALDALQPPVTKVVGNIPYQITSPIFRHLFGEIGSPSVWHRTLERVVLTMQLEVARRLVALPGGKDYSHLTVMKEYLFDAEILFEVPADSFHPPPEVRSAVVKMVPRKEPPIKCADIKLMKRIIAAGFKQRRKVLKNTLHFLPVAEPSLTEIFRSVRVNPMARAEDLTLTQFANLTDAISNAG